MTEGGWLSGHANRRDLRVTLRFRTTEEGGRAQGVSTEFPFYGAPLRFGERAFDGRFLITQPMALGERYTVDVTLLDAEGALPFIRAGMVFEVVEGKVVGDGRVEAVFGVDDQVEGLSNESQPRD